MSKALTADFNASIRNDIISLNEAEIILRSKTGVIFNYFSENQQNEILDLMKNKNYINENNVLNAKFYLTYRSDGRFICIADTRIDLCQELNIEFPLDDYKTTHVTINEGINCKDIFEKHFSHLERIELPFKLNSKEPLIYWGHTFENLGLNTSQMYQLELCKNPPVEMVTIFQITGSICEFKENYNFPEQSKPVPLHINIGVKSRDKSLEIANSKDSILELINSDNPFAEPLRKNLCQNNLFEKINMDEIKNIFSDLNNESIYNLSRTSRSFFNLCNPSQLEDWIKNKLSQEFNISAEYLLQQHDVLQSFSINLKDVYFNLRKLSKNQKLLPTDLLCSYKDQNNLDYLFASCTNNLEYFCSIIPFEECEHWSFLSVFAGCEEPFMFSLDCSIRLKKESDDLIYNRYLQIALMSGRKDLLISLLNQSNSSIKLDSSSLEWAVYSGSIELFEYLLESSNQFNLKLDSILNKESQDDTETLLNFAANKGHLELVKLLISKGFKPNFRTLEDSINSENCELVKFFLNNYHLISNFEQMTKLYSISVKAGSKEVNEFLRKVAETLDSKAEIKVNSVYFITSKNNIVQEKYWKRQEATYCQNNELFNHFFGFSGNVSILNSIKPILVNSKFNNALKLDKKCLNIAAKNGHLDMVRTLIEEYKIVPTEDTLIEASFSNNLNLIKYLLDEKFDIPVDIEKRNTNCTIQAINRYLICTFLFQIIMKCFHNKKVHFEMKFIKDALASSFEFAPQHHLNIIALILLNPNSYPLDKEDLIFFHNYLNNLSKSTTGISSLPIYGKIYSNQINKMISRINEDYSEESTLINEGSISFGL